MKRRRGCEGRPRSRVGGERKRERVWTSVGLVEILLWRRGRFIQGSYLSYLSYLSPAGAAKTRRLPFRERGVKDSANGEETGLGPLLGTMGPGCDLVLGGGRFGCLLGGGGVADRCEPDATCCGCGTYLDSLGSSLTLTRSPDDEVR